MGNNASKPEDDVCFEGKFFTTGDGIKLSSSVVKRLSQDEREAKEHRAKLEAQAKAQADERAQKSADPNYISPFSGHQNHCTQITHDSKQFFSEGPNFNRYKSSFSVEPNDIYQDQFRESDFKSEANVNPCFDDPKTTCSNEQPTTCHPIPNMVVSDAPSPITTSRPPPKLVSYENSSDDVDEGRYDVREEVTSPTLLDQIGQDAIDKWRRDLNAMKEVFDCEDPSNPYDGTSSQFEPFAENYRSSVPDEKSFSPTIMRIADDYLKPYVPSTEAVDRKPKVCGLNEEKSSDFADDSTYFPVRAPSQQSGKVEWSDDDTNLIDIEDLEQQEGDFHPGEHEAIMCEGDGKAKEEPIHHYEVADIFTKDPFVAQIEHTCPAPTTNKKSRTPMCETVSWRFEDEPGFLDAEDLSLHSTSYLLASPDKIKNHLDSISDDFNELVADLEHDDFTKSLIDWKADIKNKREAYAIAPEMAEAIHEFDEIYKRMYSCDDPDEEQDYYDEPPEPTEDELMLFSVRNRELHKRLSKDEWMREDDDTLIDLQPTTAIMSPSTTDSNAMFELKYPVHEAVENNEACNWRNVNSFTTIADNKTVNTFDENFCKEQETRASRRNWHTSVEGHVYKFDDLTPSPATAAEKPRSWSNHIIKQFSKSAKNCDQDDETKLLKSRRSRSKRRRSEEPKSVKAFTTELEQLEADPTGLSSTRSQESSVDGAEFFSKKSMESLKRNRVAVLKESSDLEQISTVAYQEFEDAAKKIEEKFQPAGSKAVCSDTESSLLECYKTNPRKPLLCNKQLQHFKECVAASKKEMFARRGLASE